MSRCKPVSGDCDFDFSSINGGHFSRGLIAWTEEIKFLGFYVARRGGLRKYVEYLQLKEFKKINIVKALLQTRYGAHSFHLLILTISSIRSMIEYGAAILSTASETIFKKLEVLQTTAIRTVLGLLKLVPNIVLRKYAGTALLYDRIGSVLLSDVGSNIML